MEIRHMNNKRLAMVRSSNISAGYMDTALAIEKAGAFVPSVGCGNF